MAGAFRNAAVSELTGSPWLAGFNRCEPNFINAVWEAVYGCFATGANQYNGVLWTIRYLYVGAVLVYLCAWMFGDKKWRYVVYAIIGTAVLMTDYAGIFFGFVLCDVMHTQEKLVNAVRKQKVLLWFVFAVGVYLSSYPSAGAHLEGTIYGIIPIVMVVPFHLAGALLFVAAAVCLEPLQNFFGWKMFVKLGDISYSLYLVHFPVIATLGCFLFELLYGKMSYHLAVLLVFGATTAATLAISAVFRKYIEPLGKKGEFYVESIFAKSRSQYRKSK